MSLPADQDDRSIMDQISLILPLTNGHLIDDARLTDYLRVLQSRAGFDKVEVIVATGGSRELGGNRESSLPVPDGLDRTLKHVVSTDHDWSSIARAGMSMATGDPLLVIDPNRPYASDDMLKVIAPVRAGETNIAVGVPGSENEIATRLSPTALALRMISRVVLGSSDVFSGLYVVRRSVWNRLDAKPQGGRYNLLLDLLRKPPKASTDVSISAVEVSTSSRLGMEEVRQLKHLLDARFGTFSRLIQFCMVGASGMVVDLSFYALFQWLLSFTPLGTLRSTLFGFSWNLAIAGGLSISLALLWNFSLNRRLTFNDARKRSWFRQFLAYALSNALAIPVSLTLRLFLPMRVPFFSQHKLAAAVVGIVVATGISFSMSRYLVFSKRTENVSPTLVVSEG